VADRPVPSGATASSRFSASSTRRMVWSLTPGSAARMSAILKIGAASRSTYPRTRLGLARKRCCRPAGTRRCDGGPRHEQHHSGVAFPGPLERTAHRTSGDSKAQAEQVRSVSVERLGPIVGRLSPSTVAAVDDALRLHLDL